LALFTVNTGSGSVSRYLIARSGALTLLGSTPVRGGSAVAATDDRLSPDGRYLFVVESRTGAVGKFRIAADLDRLWAAIPAPAAVTVVLESTRNARVPLSAWFRRRGARVILVPPEQSADLREYYFKHTKSDLLTELPVAVSQVSGQAAMWLATVARHDHWRRCTAGLVSACGAAARVA